MKVGDYVGYHDLWLGRYKKSHNQNSELTPLGIIVAAAYVGDDPLSVNHFEVLQADGDIVVWNNSVLEVINEAR